MPTTLQVSTRQFLRNFKNYKELLRSRKVESFTIPIDSHEEMSVTLKKSNNTGENIARVFEALKKPIHIKRRNIFEGLFSRR